ncbi:amiloride-sensitive sodium channel subunit alpha-like [Acanthaster planci]|uniref:Amiloride-sensitive sodium channel subunit alpha-like n=1 Tax=Acanthaster planci TaxID=133434 RepID=A0A8B7ZBI3_ACAPL|nr:amiloride-sensitive sodium channel subunit alpha-like [Acanthaster planci]
MADEKSGENDARSLRALFKNLMGNTSAHGLPNIDRAGNPFRRCFWSVLFVWALGMFLWQCYELVYAYFQWEVDVNINIQYKTQIDFPAVTICNLNPVKASSLSNSRELEILLGSLDSETSGSTDGSWTAVTAVTPKVTSDQLSVNSTDGELFGGTASSVTKLLPATEAGLTATGDTHTLKVSSERDQLTPTSTDASSPSSGVSSASPAGSAPTHVVGGTQMATNAVTAGVGIPTKEVERRKRDTSTNSERQYQNWDNIDYTAKESDVDLFDQVADAIAKTEYGKRLNFGHSIDDMLLACSYKGYPCGPTNFSYFHNYLYGNCYTFNAGMNSDIQTSSKPGPLYGLILELNLEETEYIPSIQQASGARVVIDQQYRMPFPEDAGINVAPGVLTSIGIRKVEIDRKSDPYTNCTERDSDDSQTVFSDFFGANYSLEACQKNCLYEEIFERCDCADTRFRFLADRIPCLSTNSSQTTCKEAVEHLYANDEIECNCTSPCQESSFELTVSSAAWPNSEYAATVLENLRQISDDFRTKVGNDANFVQNNVLKLQVYYERLNYEMITQTPKYDGFGLISNLGGQVGLWIGISMCTVFEFVELLYDVCKILLLKVIFCSHAKRATAPSASDLKLDEKPSKPRLALNN